MARIREQTVTSIRTEDGAEHAVIQQRHPRETYGRSFVIVFTDHLEELATKIEQGLTLKVMLMLPKRLSFTDWRPLNQKQLAADLGASQGAISRSLAQLLELQVIERRGTGSGTTWRLSDEWGWRGNAASYHKHRRAKGKLAPTPQETDGLKSHNPYRGNSDSINVPLENINSTPAKQSKLRLLQKIPGSKP